MSRTIAILTDFGSRDHYVGVMKGVMRGICSDALFIDISHEVSPQALREAALMLHQSYRFFPAGTVFLVVVDPGVGSARRPLLVRAGEYLFVAPDNGVLSYVFGDYEVVQPFLIQNPHLRLSQVSGTFHGRDIFAPAAAHAALRNLEMEDFGPAIDPSTLIRLPLPLLELQADLIRGEITRIDRFGNAITSIGMLRWDDRSGLVLMSGFDNNRVIPIRADRARVSVHEEMIHGIRRAYYEAPVSALLAQVDSAGFLEIAVNQGNAAERLNLKPGDEVLLSNFSDGS